MALSKFGSLVFPAWLLVASMVIFCAGLLLLYTTLPSAKGNRLSLIVAEVDAEKGTGRNPQPPDPHEEFQLEKRAFFCKV